jgi:ribonuclease VapC
MIVDSSVLIAIVRREDDREAYVRKLATTDGLAISASTMLESRIVAQRSGFDEAESDVLALIDDNSIEVVPFSENQQKIAADAHRKFGRGSGHPARLNFGDCFAYALAKERGEPLLFKGKDFAETDIVSGL